MDLAVQHFLRQKGWRPERARVLEGSRNYTWLLDDVFIKQFGPQAPEMAYRRELAARVGLNKLGLMHDVPLAFDPKLRIIITRALTPGPAKAEDVAKLVVLLHNLPTSQMPEICKGPSNFDAFFTHLERRIEKLVKAKLPVPDIADIARDIDEISVLSRWVWAHGDLHKSQTMLDANQKAVIIDWEASTIAPPEWDIATALLTCNYAGLNCHWSKDFVAAYCRYGGCIDDRVLKLALRLKAVGVITWLGESAYLYSDKAWRKEYLRRLDSWSQKADVAWGEPLT